VLQRLAHVVEALVHLLPEDRDPGEDLVQLLLEALVEGLRSDLVQVLRERAHRHIDRHAVVVQDDDEIPLDLPGMVQGLEGHARRYGGVPDDGNRLRLPVEEVVRHGDTQGQRHGRTRVTRVEKVEDALALVAETADPLVRAERVEPVPPPRDQLVRVGLVAHVPDQAVPGQVEHAMQGQRDLDRAEVGRQVAPVGVDDLHDPRTDLAGEPLEFVEREALQVVAVIDSREDVGHRVLLARSPGRGRRSRCYGKRLVSRRSRCL
jgi:hypothetical protein